MRIPGLSRPKKENENAENEPSAPPPPPPRRPLPPGYVEKGRR